MDGNDVSQAEFSACLEDLARVNTWTFARRPTLDFISKCMGQVRAGETLTIVDVGFGAGDMLIAIRDLMQKRGRSARLIGYDINPRSEHVARSRAGPERNIEFRTGDAFEWPDGEPLDIVISSLVTHHMGDAEILRFLSWMEAKSRLGWLINDLHRHRFPYCGFGLLAAAMRWHPFVRHDGPLSIARAFHRDEWVAFLEAADLAGRAEVSWWFPFRYCVERRKW